MNIEEAKKEAVESLKTGLLESMSDGFIEDYEKWKSRMETVNYIINESNGHQEKKAELYKYDEFCKEMLNITKKCLEEKIDYEKLFLNQDEYFKIIDESIKNKIDHKELISINLQKRFFENVIFLINTECVVGVINNKLQLEEEIKDVRKEIDRIVGLGIFKNMFGVTFQ